MQPYQQPFGSPLVAADDDSLTSLVVIPARLQSTRLPRKMLLSETGKPLIQHTYESASRALLPRGVCVATDHIAIARAVRRFGGVALMTSPLAKSGTERCAEIAQRTDVDVVVNVQGDEPEISGAAVDLVVQALQIYRDCEVATLATPITSRASLADPNCVKVVLDHQSRALYFSRSPIPAIRDDDQAWPPAQRSAFLQHVGLYAYRRDFLARLADLPESPLEQFEKLEQLRLLQAGASLHVTVVEHAAKGIDTPQDYQRFVERFRGEHRLAG